MYVMIAEKELIVVNVKMYKILCTYMDYGPWCRLCMKKIEASVGE